MSKQIYTLTFDSGAGLTTWRKTADELLTVNGNEPLIAWMLREADATGRVIQFATGRPVQGYPTETLAYDVQQVEKEIRIAFNPEFKAQLDAAEAALVAKDRAEKAKIWTEGYQAGHDELNNEIDHNEDHTIPLLEFPNPYED